MDNTDFSILPTKDELRRILQTNLDGTIAKVNAALRGNKISALETVLARIGRGQVLPHWYQGLKANRSLPNLDGKTIGSVVEMLLIAVLETHTFAGLSLPPMKINPARGVDLPDLDLGVKSPSENFCTSEPFYSPYERLLGSDHDVLVLLTDYQQAKKNPPLKLQIIKWRYLNKTQLADKNLCGIALKNRAWLVEKDESFAKRVFRFLAFVNQSDWRAKRILRLIEHIQDEQRIREVLVKADTEFQKMNAERLRKDKIPTPDTELEALKRILEIKPLHVGIVDAAENWVVEVIKETARLPNGNEWSRLLNGPLDGIIGISPALQWRYNFGPLFGMEIEESKES